MLLVCGLAAAGSHSCVLFVVLLSGSVRDEVAALKADLAKATSERDALQATLAGKAAEERASVSFAL
jgi:hypothetical protein